MMAAHSVSTSNDYDYDYGGGVSDNDLGGGSVGVDDGHDINNHHDSPQQLRQQQQQQRQQQRQQQQMDRYVDHDELMGQPHYMTGALRGKPCSYYVNGDKHYPAKKIVVNPKHFRDMSHYLDHLTDKLDPPFGAIRKLHTPHHGTRVYNVSELKPGEAYVAAGGERFRRIGYDQIVSHERKKSPPFKYDANPVVHSRVFQCSGKIRKIENSSIIIKVWPNGGEKRTRRPRVVLLRRTPGWNMSTVTTMVDDMLKDDCNGPVEALYNRNGLKLADVDSLEHNGVYVALTRRDRFKRASYPDFATKDLHTSPRPDRKMLDPLYSRSNNSTSQSSPEHSNASSSQGVAVNGQPRRRPPKGEEDQVFPAKPVKHNRSFDRAKKVDLDKDEGGVFKAKNSNSHTRGAREINDTRQTKVDLPLDQQKASEVDEDISHKARDDPYHQPSRPPAQPRGYPEAKPNSRRPPPAKPAPAPAPAPKRGGRDQEPAKDVKAEREWSPSPNYRRGRTGSPPPTGDRRRPLSAQSTEHKSVTPTQNGRAATPPKHSPSPPPAYDFREEEQAATRIQAGYRGFVARKQVQAKKTAKKEAERGQSQLDDYQSIAREEASKVVDNANDRFDEEEKAATRIQAGFRGFKSRKEFEVKKAQSQINSQNKEEEMAATRIQANYRGHKTRESLKERNNNSKNDNNNEDVSKPQREEEEEDTRVEPKPTPRAPAVVDDDDDEDEDDDYDKAATKIQAGFRGYQVRKSLRT